MDCLQRLATKVAVIGRCKLHGGSREGNRGRHDTFAQDVCDPDESMHVTHGSASANW